MRKKVFLSALLGNIVEYYDYSLYGFLAGILSASFFPSNDPAISLLKTFGVFALGSFAKPLGAIVFSRLGDRFGRKVALRFNIIGIALPTVLIGLLPSYEIWGYLSPLILILCRLVQGFFVGGEADGVRIFILEHTPRQYACFANSLSSVSATGGIYLASLAAGFFVLPSLPSWSWRIPFLLGGVLGIITVWLRRYLLETPDFIKSISEENHTQATPFPKLIKILSQNKRSLFATILLCGSVGGTYHYFLVFWNIYLSKILGMISQEAAGAYTSVGILVYTLSAPIAGFIADHWRSYLVLKYSWVMSLLLIGVSGLVLWYKMSSLILFLLLAIALSFFSTPLYALLMQQFPVRHRYQCLSIGHSIGSLLFSGTAPLIGTFLWQKTQLPAFSLIYPFFLLGIAGVGLKLLKSKG
jgi:MHS family proline/betaine transporter-like MFS transporter